MPAEDAHLTDTNSQKQAAVWPLLLTIIAVVALWLGLPYAILTSTDDWETRGQVGDLFGVVNSLFSALAFAVLIYTMHLQRQELTLQRKELALTRAELKRAASAQEASEKALLKQAIALETAARLTALSSVIQHYPTKIAQIGPATQRSEAERQQVRYVEQLEAMLARLGSV
jgi:hypothetical protein